MHRILGMAKSHLDLNGAKPDKLERDFLRLLYAKKRLEEAGDEVAAVLVVMTDAIKSFCDGLATKYDAVGAVTVVVAPCSQDELQELVAEKDRNREGMIRGTQGERTTGLSNAKLGRHIGESHLR